MGSQAKRQWQDVCRCGMWAFLLVVLGATSAYAQFDRGTISGTIKDAQGGVVPGVTVTITSTATQQTRTTVTDGSGFYHFPNLQPSKYDISAELQGFKKASRTGVQVDAASALSLDFGLETGSLAEEVTVTAEASMLQSDVAVRKTVEAKDIELLSFSGRNPIGVPALKPGVVGGNFNNAGFAAFTNGGFSINGGRPDENTITVDGAVAIRTRSAGTMIGVQNVDAIQEVQVLTANYMPEYGRASGGQIRFITKSGSNRYTGNASVLPARRVAPVEYLGPQSRRRDPGRRARAVRLQTVRLLVRRSRPRQRVEGQAVLLRGPGVGELLPGPDQHRDGSDRGHAARRFQRAAVPVQRVFQHGADHPRPPDGPAVPGQRHPARTPVAQRHRADEAVSASDGRLPPGHGQRDLLGQQPGRSAQGQPSLRLPAERQEPVHVPVLEAELRGARRVRRDVPVRAHRLGSSEHHAEPELGEHHHEHPDQRVQLRALAGRSVHRRLHGGGTAPAHAHGRRLSVHLPGKEIEEKIPTVNLDTFSSINGGPYPAFSRGPITTFSNATTWVKGRHAFKAGIVVEYSGEDDFDQINVNSIPGGTNNQNGQFEFRNGGANRTGVGMADLALGLFTNYAEIGERAFTKWRSLATDVFVQDSWKPTAA